jgi:hypothetical protein
LSGDAIVNLVACVSASGGEKLKETLTTANFAHRAKKMEAMLSHQHEDPIAMEKIRLQMENNNLRRLLLSHRRYTKTKKYEFEDKLKIKKQQYKEKCDKLKQEKKDLEKKLTDKITKLQEHAAKLEEVLLKKKIKFTPMPEEPEVEVSPVVQVSFFYSSILKIDSSNL